MIVPYAGITTTISGSVTTATGQTISITGLDLSTSDIKIGDYLQVDDEVVRVKNTVVPGVGAVTVYRGVLGTKATTHMILEQ